MPPGQFPIIVLILRLAESLSHANVRLDYGRVGERLLVSPRFHRLHHAPAFGRVAWARITRCCCRSGTGCSAPGISGGTCFRRTGAPEDPEALASGGWLRQQAVGMRRLVGAIAGR